MGLDMYLEAEMYVSTYGNDGAELNKKIQKLVRSSKKMKLSSIKFQAMYWRKANYIHRWFVNNVQGGVDECQRSEVTKAHLTLLLSTIRDVLADRDKASELLAPASGFFFGDTVIDDWYWNELIRTEAELTELLKLPEIGSVWYFYYQASW